MFFFAVLISAALYALLCAGTHLPLMADDYSWLALAHKTPAFKITDLYVFARMPVMAAMMTGVLKANWIEEYPMFFLTFLFALHATAIAVLVKTFRTGLSLTVFLVATVLFTFQPGNYEIHLWHLCSMISVGALFVAAAASIRTGQTSRSRKLWPLQVLGFALSMLVYDTFPLMICGVVGLCWILKRNDWKNVATAAVAAFVLDVVVKMVLGHLVGYLQVSPMVFHPLEIIGHLKTVLRMLGLVHFYKADWPLTLVEWTAIGILIVTIIRHKLMDRRQVALLFLLPFVAALPLALMTYSAERAYYGPQLIRGVVLAIFLSAVLTKQETRRWGIAACALFAIAYLGQWTYILHSKRQNNAFLEAQDKSLIAQMDACTSPCTLEVPAPDKGLSKDYIITKAFWPAYYDRLHFKYFPAKEIHFSCKEAEAVW
jgi:hypothetical protein